MKIKRILYLLYYFRELDKRQFRKFLKYVCTAEGLSKRTIITDVFNSVLKYNISILEYFQFGFYKLAPEDRWKFAGTGFMYEYQLMMNPKQSRDVLKDKLLFLQHFKSHVRHKYASLRDIENDKTLAIRILSNKSGKVVLKSTDGQCGRGIEVRKSNEFTPESLISRLKETGNDFVEEYVVQHNDLMRLSSSGLNTVRIITQLDQSDQVCILGARLRITINSSVDNLAAGNVAAPINLETGLVEGPGVYSDITKSSESVHPISKMEIVNFKIPFWKESLQMVKEAALSSMGNRSIGWDVAITDEGPELIEGNHDWCKLLWQLPAGKGLKPELEKYIK